MRRSGHGYSSSQLHWYRPILCWLGLHAGDWKYRLPGSCQQTRVCPCGHEQERIEHEWDEGWWGGGEVRTCSRCKSTQSRGQAMVLDALCAGLKVLGAEATVVRRRSGKGEQLIGVIDINRSPIRRVEVQVWEDSEGVAYTSEYLVQDARRLPPAGFSSVRVRTFPIFGRVVDVRWDGDDAGTGARDRLDSDIELKEAIISASAQVTVRTSPWGEHWIIHHPGADVPPAQLWDCYEKVARNLPAKKQRIDDSW